MATGIEASIVNTDVEARVADLEAASATTDAALALYQSQTTARFGTNKAAILAEGAARATADGAIADRLDVVEATNAARTA